MYIENATDWLRGAANQGQHYYYISGEPSNKKIPYILCPMWKNGFYPIMPPIPIFSSRKEIEMAGKYTLLEHYLTALSTSQRDVSLSFAHI